MTQRAGMTWGWMPGRGCRDELPRLRSTGAGGCVHPLWVRDFDSGTRPITLDCSQAPVPLAPQVPEPPRGRTMRIEDLLGGFTKG